MKKAKIAYAAWPWGLESKKQLIQALTDLKRIGFNNFESVCKTIELFDYDVREFTSIIKTAGVQPVSFYFYQTNDTENDLNRIKKSIDFLTASKIKNISIQAAYKENGGATESELNNVLSYLEGVGRLCKPYAILPSLHPHTNTMVMYENEIDFIMERTDPDLIYFGPDTAHLTAGHCNAVSIFKRYAERIRFVHLKDVKKNKKSDADNSKQGFEIYSNFLELGEGDVDIPGCLKVLENTEYDGFLTIELDKSRFSNIKSAEMNKAYMEKNGYSLKS